MAKEQEAKKTETKPAGGKVKPEKPERNRNKVVNQKLAKK